MKSFSLSVALPLCAIALGKPIDPTTDSTLSIIEAPIDWIPVPLAPNVGTFAGISTAAIAKENINTTSEPQLTKRWDLVVDVYYDSNFQGRHEALSANSQSCYNLYNGWNDQISSLRVPSGWSCYFYVDGDCRGGYLHAFGSISYVGDYGSWLNDAISSFLCYN